MENINQYPENEKLKDKNQSEDEEEAEFENPSVDPGFDTTYDAEEEIDLPENEQKPVSDNARGNDALNYNNDRENGAYNPKNI
jgi:hypothetical protein